MIKTDFERYSGRLNYNVYPTKWFKTGLKFGSNSYGIQLFNFRFREIRVHIVTLHVLFVPWLLYIPFINMIWKPVLIWMLMVRQLLIRVNIFMIMKELACRNNGRDAIAETEFNQRELVRVNQTGHTYLTLTPVEGLNLTANYSINNIDYRRKVYENPYVGDGTAGPGRLNQMSNPDADSDL